MFRFPSLTPGLHELGLDHATDALGYMVMGVFPMTGSGISEATVFM